MKEFYGLIDEHLAQYENGTVTISDDIEFSMRQTVRQITHYILFFPKIQSGLDSHRRSKIV